MTRNVTERADGALNITFSDVAEQDLVGFIASDLGAGTQLISVEDFDGNIVTFAPIIGFHYKWKIKRIRLSLTTITAAIGLF